MSQTAPENRSSAVAIRTVVALVVVALGVWALFHVNPADAYLWVKSLHVIAVIAWMAGMLYLPRLFVYHTAAKPGSETSETFKVMEKRLLRFIINPAMIVTWIAGLWMAWEIYGFQGGWLHAKLLLVVLMSGLHGYLSKSTRLFAEDRNIRSAKHWRIINEVPTVLMILIVILVIVKPF
ncbi:protoporphyrinogen oxidase HemJ [Brucella intermedia]|uniref:Protoporphyrinogen IX oxidase n=1 Tax=Brucella intermedia TaxID=94625 RepID=A0A7V6PFG6_9HYPH|nr:protoporphyrinogen oxidase HemJ [Brucella intermedia]WGG59605.1 protoporphyrinogen oxidase HemJ [Brucella intermedia]HHV70004.1 protoporphyrinogen oxidase HemJ [Brucella intermedia]